MRRESPDTACQQTEADRRGTVTRWVRSPVMSASDCSTVMSTHDRGDTPLSANGRGTTPMSTHDRGTTLRSANHRGTTLRSANHRGTTLMSVMLLLIALVTAGLLAVRSARRELDQAGAAVARERARTAAQAAVGLARARLEILAPARLDRVLAGSRPQRRACSDPCRDCLPRRAELVVEPSEAAGTCVTPPCARPGAVVRLPDASGARVHWCDIPLRQLLQGADAQARVSIWVRNDRADGLDGGGWRRDQNRHVVVTAIARVRGSTAISHEVVRLRDPPGGP